MRHQRLKLEATVEFPPGFHDTHDHVISAMKNAALAALKEEHHRLFGAVHWPVELHVRASWLITEEVA